MLFFESDSFPILKLKPKGKRQCYFEPFKLFYLHRHLNFSKTSTIPFILHKSNGREFLHQLLEQCFHDGTAKIFICVFVRKSKFSPSRYTDTFTISKQTWGLHSGFFSLVTWWPFASHLLTKGHDIYCLY